MATTDFVVKNGLVVTDAADILSTADAASATDTTSSIHTAGGLAVAKKVFVGTDLSVGGNTAFTGDLAVNGGDITTTATTFNLANANATTVNFAGAATTLEIGAATGTTNINNNLDVDGDVNIDGGDLTVSTTTFNLANATATTVNAFGAATTIEIGAATGTTNINNNLDVDGDVNIDGGDLTVSTSTFNLANTNATTANAFGAATAITIGAATGTFTVNNQQTVFNSTDSIQLPAGNTAQRDQTPVAGQIRYNSQLATFEGYGPNNTWGSLGGVRDVDGNTYIVPELTPGGNQNTLYFYNNATQTATLSETTFTLNQNTASTTTSSGALVVTGGAGVGGNLNVGGNQTLTGDLAVNGADITTTAIGTANIFNTNATTVNAFGAATAISIGAATGTTTINNANTVVTGDLAVNGGDVTTSSTGTATVFNTNATTANAFGAATTISIGAATGTTTINNANTVVTGDLAVNGGDVTTSSTGTATVFNTNATGLSIGGAATSINIGAATGTTTIRNQIVTFTNATDINFNGASPTIASTSTGTLTLFNTNLTTVNAFGAGTAITIGAVTGTTTIRNANTVVTGDLAVNGGDVTTTSTGTATVFNTNATVANAFGAATTISIGAATGTTTINNANTVVTGDLAVNGGDVTTGATTFNLLNTTVTTGNLFGAGTAITIGDVTGTTTIRNATTTITGNANVNGGTLATSAATFNLLNATATTVNAFGAAATLAVGASTGTITVNNPTVTMANATTVNVNGANPTFATSSTGTLTLFNTNLATVTAFGTATTVNIGNATAAQTISIGNASTGASTYNFATAPTATGNTKTVNVGTAGASGSTTNVNIGSSIAGTTTINSGTVVGALTTQNLYNTLTTVVNAFGAAGTINMGANSGTLTIGNPTVVGTQATVNLWNSTSTTVNFAGAATAVNIGASTGTTTINTPQLRIGGSDTGNFISFRGTTGDQPGSFNHTYIGERIHAASESSELLIFKGNDPIAAAGPDRVRVFAGEFRVDTYTAAVSDTFENVGASAAAVNRMLITSNGQVTLGANIASTTTGTGTLLVTGGAGVSGALFANTLNSTVASGTAPLTVASNTVVTNLNADLLDGFNSAQASTVSTVAVRDAFGDITLRLVRSEFANETTLSGAMAFRVNNSTDNYIRFCSDTAAIRTFLDVPTRTGGNASGTWAINISGNAATVTNGVYTTGDQTIGGSKTFSTIITGSITGNAGTVTNGVYTTGDQTIAGVKTFSSTISGSITGNAGTVTNGVYTTGDQTIGGTKTFSSTITGSITGNAGTITSQANSATITASTGVNANQIVLRDGNGYIFANYINFNQSETENPTISSFFTSNGDGWARKSSLAHAKNQIRGVADGTWGISITGNANTATTATTATYALNTTQGFNNNWNTDFAAAPAGSTILRGDTSSGSQTGGPGGSWWFQQNMRHTNASNVWGVQVAWGWEDNANLLRTRNVTGGSYGAWVSYLNSNNYTGFTGGLSTTNTWTGTNYFQSNLGSTSGSLSSPPLQVYSTGGNAAFMSFHRAGAYAVNMGLDSDNVLRIGGWSASANRLQLDMSGNLTLAGGVFTTVLSTGATATSGTVTGQWTLGAGSTWQATFADLAEYYPSDEEYEPGTVLVFGGESEITMSTTANDRKLAGVVSTHPAYIMNAGCEGTRVCMALQGRVPVKVIGTVERGDMLVSSNVAGYAMVNNEPTYGCVIGKAIESKTSEEPGLILVSINI